MKIPVWKVSVSVQFHIKFYFTKVYNTIDNHNRHNTTIQYTYSWPPAEELFPEKQLVVKKEQGA